MSNSREAARAAAWKELHASYHSIAKINHLADVIHDAVTATLITEGGGTINSIEAAVALNCGTANAVRKLLERHGIHAVGREPGRAGLNLYNIADVNRLIRELNR